MENLNDKTDQLSDKINKEDSDIDIDVNDYESNIFL